MKFSSDAETNLDHHVLWHFCTFVCNFIFPCLSLWCQHKKHPQQRVQNQKNWFSFVWRMWRLRKAWQIKNLIFGNFKFFLRMLHKTSRLKRLVTSQNLNFFGFVYFTNQSHENFLPLSILISTLIFDFNKLWKPGNNFSERRATKQSWQQMQND